jgi:hypothetical protein
LLVGLVQQGKVLRVVLETLAVAVMGLAEVAAALPLLGEMGQQGQMQAMQVLQAALVQTHIPLGPLQHLRAFLDTMLAEAVLVVITLVVLVKALLVALVVAVLAVIILLLKGRQQPLILGQVVAVHRGQHHHRALVALVALEL